MRLCLGAELLWYCLRITGGDIVFIAQGFGFCGNPVPVPRQAVVGRDVTKLFNPLRLFLCRELRAPDLGELPNFTGARAQDSA